MFEWDAESEALAWTVAGEPVHVRMPPRLPAQGCACGLTLQRVARIWTR